MKKMYYLLFLIPLILGSCAKHEMTVNSPDSKIRAELISDNQQLFYKVFLNDSLIIEKSPLGISLDAEGFDFTKELTIGGSAMDSVYETYQLTTGKQKNCVNHANQLTAEVKNSSGKTMKIIFRAYNDGIAYRYELSNPTESTVKEEISGFRLPAGSLAWAMSNWRDNEGFYPKQLTDTMNAAIYAMPFLVQTPADKYLLLHESDVLSGYCASSLYGRRDSNLFQVCISYPEYKHYNDNYKDTYEILLENERTDVIATPNMKTPWRVAIIGNSLKPIVESTLIENLARKAVTNDISWIKPGVSVFPWWGNNYANGDTVALKQYIDLAAEMKWTFIEFDVSLIGSPSYAIDLWKTTPWVKRIVDYAASKGISVYGWDERRNLNSPKKRADIFGRYQQLGIKGIKIDFINSNVQDAMAFREACLADALKYNLLVSFHGDYPPRGERRTYPNIATQEGIKGSEYYLFALDRDIPGPVHNCTVPYTRNIVGPMDYTPVAFSSPRRVTTYAHELALSVVVESGWLVMCDKPEAYLNSPAKDFLQNLVSVWDETRFLGGYPGEYFCIARRNGNTWFVAGINAGKAREVALDLSFLPDGSFPATLYQDGKDALNTCETAAIKVSNTEKVNFQMAENGGFAFYVKTNGTNF
jgi:alpha-glucosidase